MVFEFCITYPLVHLDPTTIIQVASPPVHSGTRNMTYRTYFVIGLMPDIKVSCPKYSYCTFRCKLHVPLSSTSNCVYNKKNYLSSLSILISTSNRVELVSKFSFRGNAGALQLSLTAAKQ